MKQLSMINQYLLQSRTNKNKKYKLCNFSDSLCELNALRFALNIGKVQSKGEQ